MPFPYDPTVANRFLGYGELTRRGTTFGKLTDAVAAIATAIPTTTAAHTLWNGEPIGGKCYIIDSLTWYCITSTGAASSFGMLACLNPTAVTAQPATADTLTKVTSMNGRVYTGAAVTSHTVTVVDDGWWPLNVQTAFPGAGTVTGGLTLHAAIDGRIILPPQRLLCVSVSTVGTTATGNLFVRWSEQTVENLT